MIHVDILFEKSAIAIIHRPVGCKVRVVVDELARSVESVRDCRRQGCAPHFQFPNRPVEVLTQVEVTIIYCVKRGREEVAVLGYVLVKVEQLVHVIPEAVEITDVNHLLLKRG